jgi:hypothetical protein
MPPMIARTKVGRRSATAVMIRASSTDVPAVVQPSPIKSMTGP